jgi:hypothetical protein
MSAAISISLSRGGRARERHTVSHTPSYMSQDSRHVSVCDGVCGRGTGRQLPTRWGVRAIGFTVQTHHACAHWPVYLRVLRSDSNGYYIGRQLGQVGAGTC